MFKVNEQILNDVKDNLLNQEKIDGLRTGFESLDYLTGGFANGELIIMGARPLMGKTTFACSLIDNICIKGRKKCVFLTLEMSVYKTVERLMRIHGIVKYDEDSGDDYWERIIKATDDIGKAPLYVYDTAVDAARGFIEKCREISKSEKIDIIIIDYLQLLAIDSEAVNETLVRLKQLALELDCPVLVMSQLNRSVEKREGHMPEISDLPQCKSIDEIADGILLLYRDAYYDKKADKNSATIVIAKHKRCGRKCTHICYDADIPMFRVGDSFGQI